MATEPEIVLKPAADIGPIRHVRSTVLLSSFEAVRTSQHGAAYLSALEEPHRQALLFGVAGMWMPVETAHAHYRACDALGLSADAQLEIGRDTGVRTRDVLLGTVARMAKGAGVTPWTLLPHYQRFWDRGFDGGALTITKLGPKDARIDVTRCSLCQFRHFRNALRGVSLTLIDLFCSKAFMPEVPSRKGPDTATYRVQWA